jgi:cobalt-precorrin 5A hydrolase
MKVAGFGFRAGVTLAALSEALDLAGGRGGLDALATVQDKVAGLQAFAASLGLPVIGLAREALVGQPVQTHSRRVKAMFGTGSLAEAAALSAAGPKARLLRARVQSADGAATVAIAEGGVV